jgi:hypothetical protein
LGQRSNLLALAGAGDLLALSVAMADAVSSATADASDNLSGVTWLSARWAIVSNRAARKDLCAMGDNRNEPVGSYLLKHWLTAD